MPHTTVGNERDNDGTVSKPMRLSVQYLFSFLGRQATIAVFPCLKQKVVPMFFLLTYYDMYYYISS